MVAKYRVVSEFFYGDRMLKSGYAGEDGNGFEYEGEPGPNLEPLNEEAKEAFKAAEQRRTIKRDALVTAEGAGANAELLALVREVSASNLQLEQRVKDLEGRNAASLSPENYATKDSLAAVVTRVEGVEANTLKLREDVDEHDQGLTLHEDRLTVVEGIVNRPPPETPAPAPSPEPSASPPPSPAEGSTEGAGATDSAGAAGSADTSSSTSPSEPPPPPPEG